MLNDGLYKKYEWGGIGDYNLNAMTKESKKNGYTSATSNISTEGSTAAFDPKYSSNISTSEAQSTSSTGECSLFALEERKNQREVFISQNYDQIKKNIAMGSGDHLSVLAWFSLCEDSAQQDYNLLLQKNFEKFFLKKEDKASLSEKIDHMISEEDALKKKCHALTMAQSS